VNALENAPSESGASAEAIADAVWDELSTGHTDAGKAGAQMWTSINTIQADTDLLDDVSGGLADIHTDVGAVKTDTAAILLQTGTNGVVVNATGLASDAVDEILDEVVEGTTTLRQAVRILLAALAGKSTGGGTATLTFRDIADSKARITATVDADGNRTAITRDGT